MCTINIVYFLIFQYFAQINLTGWGCLLVERQWLACAVQWLSGLVARLTVSSLGVVFQSDRKRDRNCQLNARFTVASLVEEQSRARWYSVQVTSY